MANSFPAFPVQGGDINPSTNTGSSGTKVDSGMNLAGRQVVPQAMTNYDAHLPYSPAGGAPTHPTSFSTGGHWTAAEGSVHPSAGNGAV